MSKNSKNRRNLERAKSFSALRKNGQKGPAATKKLHTKRNTWYNTGDRARGNVKTSNVPVEQLVANQPVEQAA